MIWCARCVSSRDFNLNELELGSVSGGQQICQKGPNRRHLGSGRHPRAVFSSVIARLEEASCFIRSWSYSKKRRNYSFSGEFAEDLWRVNMASEEAFEPPPNPSSAVRPPFLTGMTRIRVNAARSVRLAHGGCASYRVSRLGRALPCGPPPSARGGLEKMFWQVTRPARHFLLSSW